MYLYHIKQVHQRFDLVNLDLVKNVLTRFNE